MIGAVASDNTIVIEQDKKKDYTKFLEDNIRNKALIILNLLASNDKLKQTAKRNVYHFDLITQ